MTCRSCGMMDAVPVDVPKDPDGSFIEQWECPNCGAAGSVYGDSEKPPQEWRRAGMCFDVDMDGTPLGVCDSV